MSNSDREQTKDVQLYAGGQVGDGHNASVGVNEKDEAVILYQDTLGTKIDYGSCEKKDDYFVFIDRGNFDKGNPPGADMNEQHAVQIHKSEVWSSAYYSIGTINADITISWEDSESFTDGNQPDIAINNNKTVIEVHSAKKGSSDELLYTVGYLGREEFRPVPLSFQSFVFFFSQ